MPRTPKRLQQKAWEGVNARYASLDNPEWETMSRLPVHFWDDDHNHKRYIQWLSLQLGIKELDDWYQVSYQDFCDRRGGGFLEYYEHSYAKALQHHFLKHDWKPWLFQQAPNRYWHDLNNCKKYVRWFEEQSGFKSIKDWYRIQQDDVYALNGHGLMDHFACSVIQLVSTVYPNHDWKPWLFSQVPKNFWSEKKNRISYMKWLGKHLGYKKPDDWYQVTKLDFINNHGGSPMQSGYKPVDLIRELYPNRRWLQWQFIQVSKGFWKSKDNRLDYLKWLGTRLGYKTVDDWFNVKHQDFGRNFGGTLLTDCYQGDVILALSELFPGHQWHPWKFHRIPTGFWDDIESCRTYLEWLETQLGFRSPNDWYKVRLEDFRAHFGTGFIKRFKTPYRGLCSAWPNQNWLPWMFENVPVGFWYQSENRTWYLKWVGDQLKFKRPEQWRQLTAKQLRSHRGNGILAKVPLRQIRIDGESVASNSLEGVQVAAPASRI